MWIRPHLGLAATLFALFAVPSVSQAQILWSSPTGTNWMTASNWTGGVVPDQTQIAQFGANPTGTAGVGINFNAPTNGGIGANDERYLWVGAIEVTSDRASALTIGNSATVTTPAGTFQMFGATVNGVANTIIRNNSSQLLTIQNTQGGGNQLMNLELQAATSNIAVDGTGNVAINTNITQAPGAHALRLTTSNSGSLILGGANTFTGGVIVEGGVGSTGALQLNATTALPSTGTVTVNTGGRLHFGVAGTFGATNQSLTLNPNQTATAAVSTQTGAVTWQGTVALSAASNVGVGGTSLTFSGNVSGGGTLVKSGAGNLILSGTGNTRTGDTVVTNGTLTVNAGSTLGGGALTLAQTGTSNTAVVFNNAAQTIGNLNSQFAATTGTVTQTITLNNTALTVNQMTDGTFGNGMEPTLQSRIAGSGSLIKAGDSVLTLGGPNTYTGATTVNAGTLRAGVASVANMSGAFGLNSNVTLGEAAGVTLDLNGFDTQIGGLNGGGGSAFGVTLGSATLTVGGGTSGTSTANYVGSIFSSTGGGLTKTGAGTQILSGTNSYTGVTTVNQGTLLFATPSALYAGNETNWNATNIVVNTGGVLGVRLGNGTNGFTTTQLASLLQLGTDTGGLRDGSSIGIDTTNGDATIVGVITNTNSGANALGLVKLGANTLTLNADHTYTGPTVIREGTLQVGGGGNSGSLGTGAVTNNAALVFNRSDSVVVANNISGSGSVTFNGAGTATLTGTNSYTGATAVNTGTVLVNGNNSAATGAITVAGGATLGGTGTLGGATTVQSGGTIRGDSGTGTGTLTVRNVTIESGGILGVNMGESVNQVGTSNRLAFGANTLDLTTGAVVKFTPVTGFGAQTGGEYVLATFDNGNNILLNGTQTSDGQVLGEYTYGTTPPNTGPIVLDVTALPTLLDDSKLTVRRSGNNLVLSFSPVPEPASLLAVCGLVVAGAVTVRRLRKRAEVKLAA